MKPNCRLKIDDIKVHIMPLFWDCFKAWANLFLPVQISVCAFLWEALKLNCGLPLWPLALPLTPVRIRSETRLSPRAWCMFECLFFADSMCPLKSCSLITSKSPECSLSVLPCHCVPVRGGWSGALLCDSDYRMHAVPSRKAVFFRSRCYLRRWLSSAVSSLHLL